VAEEGAPERAGAPGVDAAAAAVDEGESLARLGSRDVDLLDAAARGERDGGVGGRHAGGRAEEGRESQPTCPVHARALCRFDRGCVAIPRSGRLRHGLANDAPDTRPRIFPIAVFDQTLNPERLAFFGPAASTDVTSWEIAKRWFNFGALEVDADRLTMRIVDTAGESPFSLPLARR